MARYWWVNHKQTHRQEVGGGYLWSPKTEDGGKRSEFYNNMRRAEPGDLVLSYATAAIRYVGRVTDFATTARKPSEFGPAGENWADEGWLLPVEWTPFARPIRPKGFMGELAPLLPVKYSPINRVGGGSQKAYLAEISSDAFKLVASKSAFAFSSTSVGAMSRDLSDQIEDEICKQIIVDRTLSDTEKAQLIKARIGQGAFRNNVSHYESGCRITGIQNPRLLVASHIKPWRSCASSQERLDGENGFLMTAHIDLLFDRGFISFADDGELLISPRIAVDDLRRLGLPAVRNVGSFTSGQRGYLAFHRDSVFLSSQPNLPMCDLAA